MNGRRTVYYTGRVQGVGFRFTARRIASNFPVGGTVRNLADGRVELVAEGADEDLDSFLDALQSELADFITDVSLDQTPGTGQFDSFRIAY